MSRHLSSLFAPVVSLGILVAPWRSLSPSIQGNRAPPTLKNCVRGEARARRPPGRPRAQAGQVSQACTDAVKTKLQALVTACAAEVQKFCAGISMGTGKVIDCLDKNSDGLSDNCKAEFKKVKAAAAPASK